MTRALALYEQRDRPRSQADMPAELQAISILHAFAALERDRDRLAEAALRIDQAIAKLVRLPVYSVRAWATTLYLQGLILHRAGELPAALELHRAALADRARMWDRDHAEVADSLDALGITLRQLSRFAEADACYEAALRVRREVLRPDHPVIGQSLHNLARLRHSQGRYAEAEQALCDALVIQRAAHGDRHSITALYLRSLGITLLEMGRSAEARDAASSAYDIYLALFPDGHSETAVTATILARISLREGDTGRAANWLDQALPQARRTANRIDRSSIDGALVPLLLATNRLAEAESVSMRRLEDLRAIHRGDNVDVAHALMALAEARMRRGRLGAAREAIVESNRLRAQLLGENHPLVAEGVHNLAFLEWQAGDLELSAELFREAVRLRDAARGSDDGEAWNTRFMLGRVLSQRRADEAAFDVLTQCLAYYRAERGSPAAVRVSDCAILLSEIERRRGAAHAAEYLLESALHHVTTALGPADRRLRPLLNQTARFYPGLRQLSIAPLYRQWSQSLADLQPVVR